MYMTPKIEFSDEPVGILNDLIKVYSARVLEDYCKLKNILRNNDKGDKFSREINLLSISLEANIPNEILGHRKNFSRRFYLMVQQLRDRYLIEEPAARWAVLAWAKALEIFECSEEKKLEDLYKPTKTEKHYDNCYDKEFPIRWSLKLILR